MSYLTLEYSGTEKTLAAWGVALDGCVARFTSLRPDTLTLVCPTAAVSDVPIFATEGKVILRSGRTSLDGSDDSFSDGQNEFIGYLLSDSVSAEPLAIGVQYQFVNALYLLEQTIYQQQRASVPTSIAGVEFKYTSDLSLFQYVDGSGNYEKWTTGRQIFDALDFLLRNPPTFDADPYRIGSNTVGDTTPTLTGIIEPALNVPSFQVAEMSCAEVLRKAMDPSPDCTLYWDYNWDGPTSTYPKVYCRRRSNLTPVTLSLADDPKSVKIKARTDLQAVSVLIYYRITTVYDGRSYCNLVRDKYGDHGANSASDPDAGYGVVIQTFDLSGRTISTSSVTLKCAAVDAQSATLATRKAWWDEKHPEIKDIIATDLTSAEIVADHDQDGYSKGDTVSLGTFPNELIEHSTLAGLTVGGAPVVAVTVKISTKVKGAITKKASTGGAGVAIKKIEDKDGKEYTSRVLLTNATSGVYSSQVVTPGDVIPEGVAQEVYESLATLQYEGEHVRVAATPAISPTLANTLNLTGGRTAWATMAAQIQQVTKDYGRGAVSLSIGPAKHISGADIVALCLFNRLRTVREADATRVTGLV